MSTAVAAMPIDPPPRRAAWGAWLFLCVGIIGMAALWIVASLWNGRPNGWMAVLTALDLAWMLRLGAWPRGGTRAIAAVAGTFVAALAANFGTAASQLAGFFGLDPLESAARLGLHHAWTLTTLANGPADAAWLVAGLVVAAFAGR